MSITRRKLLVSTSAAVAAATIAKPAIAAKDPILIGYLPALTGPSSSTGIGINRGVQLAVDEINKAGGVDGRPLEMIVRDTQSDPTKAVNGAAELTRGQKVSVVFGPLNSGETLAVVPMLARLNIPQLHPCWVDSLADPKKYPMCFRNGPTNQQIGGAANKYVVEVLKKKNIPAPKCWADLLDAKFRDEVQIADPNSSGTAYVMLATMVQLMGEDKGFAYLKALHRNVNQYTKSGIAPVKSTASGENGVGIAFLHDMVTMRVQGAPIQTVAPCEGTGYEIGAVSLIKGRKNAEAARRFVDWTLSAEAQKVVGVDQNIYSIPSNKAAPVHAQAPDIASIKLINYDSAKYGSSAERNRLLKKWGDEVKALPK